MRAPAKEQSRQRAAARTGDGDRRLPRRRSSSGADGQRRRRPVSRGPAARRAASAATNATRRDSLTPPTRTDDGEDNADVDNSELRRSSDVSDGGLLAKKMSSSLKFVRKEWIYARVELLNEIWS
ncbi:hypothetical protein Scep_004669 [Stephania cephalantha]|uniref:Uncharacterized protein n=1 Tax=Stephania cephalantha TaxID=152367 RepID=A0AAP0PWU7_9MAGN